MAAEASVFQSCLHRPLAPAAHNFQATDTNQMNRTLISKLSVIQIAYFKSHYRGIAHTIKHHFAIHRKLGQRKTSNQQTFS